jgi:sortase (surface protein transpeptidase)
MVGRAAAPPVAAAVPVPPAVNIRLPPVKPSFTTPSAAIRPSRSSPSEATVRPLPVGELDRSRPLYLVIPRIGVNAPVTEVGNTADGEVAVPPLADHDLAGWYREGPAPGEAGAATIVGHLDTVTGPAVFARLSELRPGDSVGVVRADHVVAVFVVYADLHTPKSAFPSAAVFRRPARPGIRLITCSGAFDRSSRSYLDNLIVFGTFSAAYRQADLRSR